MTARPIRNFVTGAFVEDGAGRFDKLSPVDGTVIAQVHEADAALVDRAVTAASPPRAPTPASRCRKFASWMWRAPC